MSGGFNTIRFNHARGVIGWPPPPPPEEDELPEGVVEPKPFEPPPNRHYSDRYILEVQNPNQQIVAFLRDAAEIRWEQAINAASTLTFRYPASKDQAAALTFPNVVILRDEDGDILDSCLIAQVSKRREAGGEQVCNVHCEGYQSVLGKSVVEDLDFEDVTVGVIAQQLIDLQPPNSPWLRVEMGAIEAGLRQRKVTHRFENVSVLQALRDLRGLVGGYYRIRLTDDGQPRFFWDLLRPSPYARRHITAGKNSPWLTAVEDYRTIRTRVIAKGARNRTSVRTSDAAKIAEYGTLTFIATHPMIEDQATLDEYAEMVLKEREQPRMEYYIGAIDLGKAETSWDYADEDLNLGDTVYIHDTHLGVQIGTAVTKIRRDLQGGMTIEVVDPDAGDSTKGWSTRRNKPLDVIDELIDLKERLDRLDLSIPDFGEFEFDWDDFWQEFDWEAPEWNLDELAERIWEEFDWEAPEFNIDDLVDRITEHETFTDAVPQPGDDIQTVGEENEPGTSDLYAREDHVHEGTADGLEWITANDKESLPLPNGEDSPEAPALGHTTSDTGYYVLSQEDGGSEWEWKRLAQGLQIVVADTKAGLPLSEEDVESPAIGYTTTDNRYYSLTQVGTNQQWVSFTHLEWPE